MSLGIRSKHYATARSSFIARQNRKASKLTTRLVLKIVFSHMRPLQEHEEEDIKEVTIQFYRQVYDYISALSDFYIRIRHCHESSFVGFAVHVVLKKYQPAFTCQQVAAVSAGHTNIAYLIYKETGQQSPTQMYMKHYKLHTK